MVLGWFRRGGAPQLTVACVSGFCWLRAFVRCGAGIFFFVVLRWLRRGGNPQLTVVFVETWVVAVVAAGAAAAVATGAGTAAAVVGALVGSVGAGIWRKDFRYFFESVDSSERFVGFFFEVAFFYLVWFGSSFGVEFACL